MTNFIFSRRDIQSRINRLSSVMTGGQLVDMVAKLNTPGKSRLPAMWEVVVLDALAQEGRLRHEIPLPSGRRPDFELSCLSREKEPLLVVGDVLTISDTGLDEQNPVDVLFEQIPIIAAKHGVNPERIGFNIEGRRVGPYGDARMQLGLPKRRELIALLHREISDWLREVGKHPEVPSQFQPSQQDVTLSVSYDPARKFLSGSHLSYDVAASREKNPLYKALRDKRAQLDGAPDGAVRLLVACDGDCDLLRSGASRFNAPGTYSAAQITDHFLNKHSGVDAVLLITVEERHKPLDPRTRRQLLFDLRIRTRAPPNRPSPTSYAPLQELLQRAFKHFPAPQRAPYNAIRRCHEPGWGYSQMGAYQMADKGFREMTVSLSARGLMELLSGIVSPQEFKQAHRWGSTMPGWNPFANALAEGRTIASAKIEEIEGMDDDWITLQFSEPDAAVAPFSAPSQDATP